MPRIAVVLTTINIPTVMPEYIANARKYGHKDIFFVIIGDRKTPSGCGDYLRGLKSEYPIHYLDEQQQIEWLKGYPASLAELIPWNSVQRRNLGYLLAAEKGADVLIAIDDDNIPDPESDYFGHHSLAGKTARLSTVSTDDGWYNSCDLLLMQKRTDRKVYHRGYPICRRWNDHHPQWTQRPDFWKAKVRVNVGLWTEDPDVDTVTRLEQPVEVKGIHQPKRKFFLAPGLWAPFNSQNTAFDAEMLPAMFLITLRSTQRGVLAGNNNFRYDDIWMSYFLKAVIDQVGGGVVVGPPHVRQVRNPHDFLVDLEKELYPMQLTNRFPDLLPRLKLTKGNAFDCYAELADQLEPLSQEVGYDSYAQQVFRETVTGMRIWLEVLEKKSLS